MTAEYKEIHINDEQRLMRRNANVYFCNIYFYFETLPVAWQNMSRFWQMYHYFTDIILVMTFRGKGHKQISSELINDISTQKTTVKYLI